MKKISTQGMRLRQSLNKNDGVTENKVVMAEKSKEPSRSPFSRSNNVQKEPKKMTLNDYLSLLNSRNAIESRLDFRTKEESSRRGEDVRLPSIERNERQRPVKTNILNTNRVSKKRGESIGHDKLNKRDTFTRENEGDNSEKKYSSLSPNKREKLHQKYLNPIKYSSENQTPLYKEKDRKGVREEDEELSSQGNVRLHRKSLNSEYFLTRNSIMSRDEILQNLNEVNVFASENFQKKIIKDGINKNLPKLVRKSKWKVQENASEDLVNNDLSLMSQFNDTFSMHDASRFSLNHSLDQEFDKLSFLADINKKARNELLEIQESMVELKMQKVKYN